MLMLNGKINVANKKHWCYNKKSGRSRPGNEEKRSSPETSEEGIRSEVFCSVVSVTSLSPHFLWCVLCRNRDVFTTGIKNERIKEKIVCSKVIRQKLRAEHCV